MESLKNLTNNLPDWQRRIDDLSSQIVSRQIELGALSSPQDIGQAEARSLRNKGSTESLKPKDDGPMQVQLPESLAASPDLALTPTEKEAGGAPVVKPVEEDVQMVDSGETLVEKPSTPVKEPRQSDELHPTSPGAALHKQARDAMLAAHARKRAQMRRRQRSSSIKSGEGQSPNAYRTRSMIIVYYDSYVQGFFDDLVRFVSASRNMMRKAKMAAKVAQIKRMAEAETPDEENGDGEPSIPSLRYMSTSRRFGGMRAGLGSSPDQPPDIYDKLDKSLEVVQSTCEHGAHQFLRDAECGEELKRIRKCMDEVLEMAVTESERIEREEPDAAKDSLDCGKARTRRPISMRRDFSSTRKDNAKLDNDVVEPAVLVSQPAPSASPPSANQLLSASIPIPSPSSATTVEGGSANLERSRTDSAVASENSKAAEPVPLTDTRIQVDDTIQADSNHTDSELPKLIYRSTRGNRGFRSPTAIHS